MFLCFKPYGVNQAGPFVKYVTTGLHGNTKKASGRCTWLLFRWPAENGLMLKMLWTYDVCSLATQLSQAAYFALQPPYIVFGLGRTPNFVEQLIVGLPSETSVRLFKVDFQKASTLISSLGSSVFLDTGTNYHSKWEGGPADWPRV